MKSREERITDKINKKGGYLLTLLCLFLFVILLGTLLWSKPPVAGRFESTPAAESPVWTMAYLQDEGAAYVDTLSEQMKLHPDVLLFAGPAALAGKVERSELFRLPEHSSRSGMGPLQRRTWLFVSLIFLSNS